MKVRTDFTVAEFESLNVGSLIEHEKSGDRRIAVILKEKLEEHGARALLVLNSSDESFQKPYIYFDDFDKVKSFGCDWIMDTRGFDRSPIEGSMSFKLGLFAISENGPLFQCKAPSGDYSSTRNASVDFSTFQLARSPSQAASISGWRLWLKLEDLEARHAKPFLEHGS